MENGLLKTRVKQLSECPKGIASHIVNGKLSTGNYTGFRHGFRCLKLEGEDQLLEEEAKRRILKNSHLFY